MSGPCLVDGVDLTDCSPPVEVNPTHEHVSFMFLVPDEVLLLPAKIFVPGAEGVLGLGALGGRIPRFASDAILDFRR